MSKFNVKSLSKKFNEQDIEWRVQRCGLGKNAPWAMIIPYVTNRAIMQRLDDVCGPENWKNEYSLSPCGKGYLCGISIKLDGEWVTRWDGAEFSGSGNIDGVKTTASNSMKRAGVQWGIGRYLYQFEATFAETLYCDNISSKAEGYNFQESKDKKSGNYFRFQWKPKPLERWAIPITEEEKAYHIEAITASGNMSELKSAFSIAYKLAISENDDELLSEFTAIKDRVKLAITENANKENDRLKLKIHEDIQSYIESYAANGVAESVRTRNEQNSRLVSSQCKRLDVDSTPHIKKLNDACNKRCAEIEGNK